MSKAEIFIDKKRTYLVMIKSAVGTPLFRHLYCRVGKKKVDLLRNGDLSCAFFVSSILILQSLIKGVHTTVSSTVKDMKKFGWVEIKKPKIGGVILWGAWPNRRNEPHQHLGFFIGGNRVISNVSAKRSPQIHHLTYGTKNGRPARKVEKIFWHPSLD